MEYKLVITDNAKEDIFDAIDWYESKHEKLGELFALSFDNAISLIVKNPFAFARIYKQIRKINTKKFPYSLYYITNQDKNEVVIFAVIHNSRSEKNWKKRLE